MYVCAGASDVNDVLSTLVCVTDWPISIFFFYLFIFLMKMITYPPLPRFPNKEILNAMTSS